MRKPRFPLVKQVYNLEDYGDHVIQVIVVGPFKDSEGLFGKHEKGSGRTTWVAIREGIGIGGSDICVFEGGQATVICVPYQ